MWNAASTPGRIKGKRLQMVRALAGLTRQQMQDITGVPLSTINSWEIGRVELNDKSANRYCTALRKIGIYCTSEWLLTGNDIPPRLMNSMEKSIFATLDDGKRDHDDGVKPVVELPSGLSEDMRRELMFFLSLHDKTLFHFITQDIASYKKGDCVAGIIVQNPAILINQPVIFQVDEHTNAVGVLLEYAHESCLASFGDGASHLKALNIAKIVWHRASIN